MRNRPAKWHVPPFNDNNASPSGVPMLLLPLVVAIEVVSFLSRPVSLSVRLFANMLAGHITLKVFAGFVVSLSALGAVGIAGGPAKCGHVVKDLGFDACVDYKARAGDLFKAIREEAAHNDAFAARLEDALALYKPPRRRRPR